MAHSRTASAIERKLYNLIIDEGMTTNQAAVRLGRSNSTTGLRLWHMAVQELRRLRRRLKSRS
jgi:hypothetical protein